MSEDDQPRFRIGEVADQAGVSPRTLRYYQELGLLDPAGSSPGGSRRYSRHDVERLRRILELRDVLGLDLERIGSILHSEDRLARLRAEVREGVTRERHRDIVVEAMAINREMRAQVQSKLAALSGFLDELEAKAARYRRVARDIGVDLGPEPPGTRRAGVRGRASHRPRSSPRTPDAPVGRAPSS